MSGLRPYSEWHEDHGDVLWWRFPVEEPPYVGGPLDLGFQVAARLYNQFGEEIGVTQNNVGGWPFLDPDDGTLFWEPIAMPRDPRPKAE